MNQEKPVDANCGLLVVGHGTRRGTGVAQLIELTRSMTVMAPKVPIEASFLELAEPTISVAMQRLAQRGVRSIIAVPILLFEAGHAKSDIPHAVEEAAGMFGIKVLGQTDPLGINEWALRLSALRFDSAARCSNQFGCLRAGGCDRVVECQGLEGVADKLSTETSTSGIESRIGLAMVGRGTSDESALASMRHFTKLRWERNKAIVAWCNTGFFAGGRPTVDELLDEAATADVDTMVVQPHLLFEGELMEQLRQKVDARRKVCPGKKWLVAMPLGSDSALAAVFLEAAIKKIREIKAVGDH